MLSPSPAFSNTCAQIFTSCLGGSAPRQAGRGPIEFHNGLLFQGQGQANSIKAFGRVERKSPTHPCMLVSVRGRRGGWGLGILGGAWSGAMQFCMGSASDYSRSGTSGRSPRGSWGPKAADDRHPKMMLVATCTGRVLVQHRRGRSRESSLYEVGQPAEPMSE